MRFFLNLVVRDIRLDTRSAIQLVLAPSFFVLVSLLYPLAMGADPEILQNIGSGVLMVSALLASLLPLTRIYSEDALDGTFDMLHFSKQPLAVYCLGKIMAHWILAGLPLLVAAPFIAMAYHLELSVFTIWAVLFPATMLFVLIGQMMAAFGVGGAVLVALLSLPLYIPVLIFGGAALGLAGGLAENSTAPLLFLWAGLSITLPSVPIVTAMILKMGRD